MRLWPRSLFGRLSLLLIGVLAIAILATILIFRQDRSALLLRHFGDTKIVQLQALRGALESLGSEERASALERLSRQHGVRIVPADEREPSGFGASGWRGGRGMRGPGAMWRDGDPGDRVSGPLAAFVSVVAQLEERFTDAIGPGVEIRVNPRLHALWIRLPTGSGVYWIGFPLPARPQGEGEPTRALMISLTLAAALVVAAFVFARYLARPLRELLGAVQRVGRGEAPAPLPESGPSEIAALNRGFNAMMANLEQSERDRIVLLAGVSHDLRTPLARLRLGLELENPDAATRAGMVADIEEMDRVIGQFLDFARGEGAVPMETTDVNALAASVVERYAHAGKDVQLVAGPVPALSLRATAIKRLLANLIDNALAYGATPVEVKTSSDGAAVVIDVVDRGDGIAASDVERLKQPFTRAQDSRARADGAPGAGLGLAIVERIARLHGGRLDLLSREGGGTIARVALPLARA
jgi:two-component system osmolarity sensor histidine kinase EnvZ